MTETAPTVLPPELSAGLRSGLPIVRAGHPALRRPAAPVADPTAPEIAGLAAQMIASLREAGGIGLAAPQVGVELRLVMFFVPPHRVTKRADDPPCDLTILCNPVIEPLGEATAEDWEGCLSMPGLRGRVDRWDRIRYSGLLLDGTELVREVGGTHARVVQHECDHLDGILYPQRMKNMRSLVYHEELIAAGGLT